MVVPVVEASAGAEVGVSRRRGALAGALAAAVALVVSELVGLLLPGRSSLLQGVGDQVISGAPAEVREWFIGLVGTADKPLLLLLIIAGVLVGGALLGAAARLRPSSYAIGATVVGVLATGVALAVAASPSSLLRTAIVAATGVASASWVFLLLVRAAAEPHGDPLMPTQDRKREVSRRGFVRAASWTAAGVAVGTGAVVAARRAIESTVEASRRSIARRAPGTSDPPVPSTASVPGIAPAVTPNADFYRIDTALYLPQVDVASWSLTVGGRVATPSTVSFADLMAMPQVERVVTMACVSNAVGGDLVGNARWQGVLLSELLARVGGPTSGAEQVLSTSVDGFTAGFPLQLALDGREPIVALFMNGEPLPVEHGFPARLVVPGLYGYVSATKWLDSIRLTTLAEETGFWVQRSWEPDGRIGSMSRIDRPRKNADLPVGRVVVAGRAWHQTVGVGSVEVQVDDGPWQVATLADAMGVDAWRLWSWQWDAVRGDHRLRVRTVDPDGTLQSDTERTVYPGAASGYHTLTVTVG